MIENKTVFVLGAGASCPYGYPSGIGLREAIYSQFTSRYKAYINKHPSPKPFVDDEVKRQENSLKYFTKRPQSL